MASRRYLQSQMGPSPSAQPGNNALPWLPLARRHLHSGVQPEFEDLVQKKDVQSLRELRIDGNTPSAFPGIAHLAQSPPSRSPNSSCNRYGQAHVTRRPPNKI